MKLKSVKLKSVKLKSVKLKPVKLIVFNKNIDIIIDHYISMTHIHIRDHIYVRARPRAVPPNRGKERVQHVRPRTRDTILIGCMW